MRKQLGRNGREKLLAEWSPEVVARQTAEVYRRAIDDRRGVARPKSVPTAEASVTTNGPHGVLNKARTP
jgi:hypothetical protein